MRSHILLGGVVLLSLATSCSSSPDSSGAVGVISQPLAPVSSCELPSSLASRLTLPAGVSLESAGVVAYGTLKVADRARVSTNTGAGLPVYNVGSSSGGNQVSEVGVTARVGSVQSVPNVFLRNFAVVDGSIVTEGTITSQGGEQVSGSRTEGGDLEESHEFLWVPQFVDGPGTGLLLQDQTSDSISAGTYGDVHVHSGSTLTLGAGTYRMNSLKLEPQSTLQLGSGAEPIVIYVANEIIWRGVVSGSGPAQKFLLRYDGTNALAIETPFAGTLIAPNASVRLGVGGTPHTGSFFAKELEVDPDVQVVHASFSHWDEVLNRADLTRFQREEPICDGDACCPAGIDRAALEGGDDLVGLDPEEICVLAGPGDDIVTSIDTDSDIGFAVLAGAGDDLVTGADGDDLLSGSEGDDTLLAGDGNDELFGGPGDDYLCSGEGDDIVYGGPGADTINAGSGDDVVYPGPGANQVDMGLGDDVVQFYAACELEGGAGSVLLGGGGADALVSPVPLSELQALGFTVSGFESVVVSPDACASSCGRPASEATYDVTLSNGNISATGALACDDDDVFLEIQRDDGVWEVLAESLEPHTPSAGAEGATFYAWSLSAKLPFGDQYFTSTGPGKTAVMLRARTGAGDLSTGEVQLAQELEIDCDTQFACCGRDDASNVWDRTKSRELKDAPFSDNTQLANGLQGVAHDDDHWYFSKSSSGIGPWNAGDDFSGLWAVPLSSSLVDFNGHNATVNPWQPFGSNHWSHPGGMDFHDGNLFVALQGGGPSGSHAMGVISADAVRGFTLATTVGSEQCVVAGKVCFHEVHNSDGSVHQAWVYYVGNQAEGQASYNDRMAWVAVHPEQFPCASGSGSCVRVYSIPFMDLDTQANDAVFVDAYEFIPEQPLQRVNDVKVLGAGGQQLTAFDFGNGRYQGGDIAENGKLYVVSDGEDSDVKDINRDSASANAVLVVQLPGPDAIGEAASEATFIGTHRVNVSGDSSGTFDAREELEGLTLWDLDAVPGAPFGGQIHVQLVNVDLGFDHWYFKHVRLEEGCEPGSITFWEGEDASEDQVCRLTVRNETINFQEDDYGCENDEASSAVLRYLPAGTKIFIHGNPNCNTSEDWAELTVHTGIYIDTLDEFDFNTSNEAFTYTWHDEEEGGGGPFDPNLHMLTGKVSCVHMEVP